MEYNPNDLNSKITLLLERGDNDRQERLTFRTEILNRLTAIEDQCKKTNGRVTKLETKQETQEEINKTAEPVISAANAGWFTIKNIIIFAVFLLGAASSLYSILK